MESRTFYGKDNDTIAADELNIKTLDNYICNIHNNCNKGIKTIAENLGINIEDLEKENAEYPEKKEKTAEYNINKGLAFELLITQWLRATDSPIKAQANCRLNKNKKPSNYAPPGCADANIDYSTFNLSVEVSSKKYIDEDCFQKQLESAIKHSEDNACLLILNASLSSNNIFKVYKEIIKNSKKPIMVLSIEELLQITNEIIDTNNATSLSQMPTSDKMKNVFTELTKCIQEHKDKDKIPKDTLTKCWVENMFPQKPEIVPPPTM